ncbi:MAG: GspH/FimT family pseudopilin [Neisseria sp.]|nr:GspH/FimT family pseudopilin [Neisseria sp.]
MGSRLQNGFTLVEVLVVLALAGIAAAWALPDLSDWLARQRMKSTAGQMQVLLRSAKQEAFRLNVPVYVCASQLKKDMQPDKHCRRRYWGQAFTAWADMDGDGKYDGKDAAGSTGIYYTDIALHSLPLQPSSGSRLQTAWQIWNEDGQATADSVDMLVFYPDGSFRHLNSLASGTLPRGRYLRIVFSEQGREAERSASLWLDTDGSVADCTRSAGQPPCRFVRKESE